MFSNQALQQLDTVVRNCIFKYTLQSLIDVLQFIFSGIRSLITMRNLYNAGSITEETAALQKRRVKMILTNLAYFTALLIIALIMFFMNAGQWIYISIAAVLIFYIFVDRPMLKGFEQDLRAAILKHGVMKRLDESLYTPKGGIKPGYITDAGFVNVITEQGFLSRELIEGRSGDIHVEIADVTFPIRENGFNKMFSGCMMHLTVPDANMELLDVKSGDVSHIAPGRERNLVTKLGEFIPGSLYLHREGEKLDILLRGRFVGFQINPLGEVHESTLTSDPLPELGTALKLAGGR